jgi:hypothetical protein
MKSSIVKVILSEEGDVERYYTLNGTYIGRLQNRARVVEEVVEAVSEKVSEKIDKKRRRRGGVVKSPTPAQFKRRQQKEAEQELTLENRLQYEKDNVL